MSYIEDHLADLQVSIHAELLARRPLELEALNGAVVRAGNSAGVTTRINIVIYAVLKALS